MEFQQKAIDAWKGHGRNAEDEIREACRVMDELKVKAMGSSSRRSLPKALALPQSSDSTRISEPEH